MLSKNQSPNITLPPNPENEAQQIYLLYLQILALTKIVKEQVMRPVLTLETPDYHAQLTELRNKIRFENYLSFLEYEIMLGFDSFGKLQKHLAGDNACSKRFSLIQAFSSIDITRLEPGTTLKDFINMAEIQSLLQNPDFQTAWKQNEIIDQPKWSSYVVENP